MEWQESKPVQRRRRPQRKRIFHPRAASAGGSVILLALALLGGLGWMVSSPDTTPRIESGRSVAPIFDPRQSSLLPTAVVTEPAGPTPIVAVAGAGNDAPAGRCNSLCLIRMPDNTLSRAELGALNVPVNYRHGGALWTGIVSEDLDSLEAVDASVAVLANAIDTAPLYIVRLPEGMGSEVVTEYGEVIDVFENQYLVKISGPPAYVLDLVDRDISIEKLPPLIAPPPRTFGSQGPLLDPWTVAEQVSVAQLKRRIEDLQSMGATGGETLGTRHYGTAGNVEAAEYLYRRLASYGLEVHYEDFVADNGRLLLNVVGEIPGRDPSQTYILTAHFDTISLDTDDPAQSPGGLDNGSGMAVLLEVARTLSQYELEHPVQIVFLNAEEYAMQGAEAFASRSLREGRIYTGGFNVDTAGVAMATNQLYINADSPSLFLQELLVDINNRYGLGIDIRATQTARIQADDTVLSLSGIPIVLVASVLYGDPIINQSNDTIAQVDLGYEVAVAQLMVIATATLAMGDG